MVKCIDCKIEDENHKGWYADLKPEGKVMRCPSCGSKEKEIRWQMHYGNRPNPSSIEEVDKQDRTQYAKDLRKANLSPWTYREE